MEVQRLFIYPIKSLLPVPVPSLTVSSTGLLYDRTFVLALEPPSVSTPGTTTTASATHLTIKTTPQLCLFRPTIDFPSQTITICHIPSPDIIPLAIPLAPTPEDLHNTRTFSISIFGSTATGHDMGATASNFFTTHLPQLSPQRVLLLHIGKSSRPIPAPSLIPKLSPSKFLSSLLRRGPELHPQQTIAFADGAPLLLTTTASERDAKGRLPEDMREADDTITRFRSNVHVSTPENIPAYDEDNWTKVSIDPRPLNTSDSLRSDTSASTASSSSSHNDSQLGRPTVTLNLVFNTPRCQSLNVDFATGDILPSEKQLYKLLTKDRRVNPAFPTKPCFGRYAFASPLGGTIRLGDSVEVAGREA